MIKALIFDCFGVIYPQATGNYFERNKNLFKNGSDTLDKLNLQIDLGQITREEFFVGLEKEIGVPAKEIQVEIDKELIVDQQLIELIKSLRKKYKIGLLSNAGKEEIAIIYRDKIDSLFDTLAVSYEVGAVKPNLKIYLACAQRLNVEPAECIFIDYSNTNLEAAERLGMKTIYYSDFGTVPEELRALE
jgi:HAD superfamily hydrolase (TIGR01509 family)